MKRILTLLALHVFFVAASFGQVGQISSFTVLPASPTPTDTIRILANGMFSSGGCDADTLMLSQQANTFQGIAHHCLGLAAVICYKTDTFKILPQPQGTYKFIMDLYVGSTSPCNTSFADKDSVTFTVGSVTSIAQHERSELVLSYKAGMLHFMSFPDAMNNAELRIVNTLGQQVFYRRGISKAAVVPVEISSGSYFIVLSSGGRRVTTNIIVE